MIKAIIVSALVAASIGGTPRIISVTGNSAAAGVYEYAGGENIGTYPFTYWKTQDGSSWMVHKHGSGWWYIATRDDGVRFIARERKPEHLPPMDGWIDMLTGEEDILRVSPGKVKRRRK